MNMTFKEFLKEMDQQQDPQAVAKEQQLERQAAAGNVQAKKKLAMLELQKKQQQIKDNNFESNQEKAQATKDVQQLRKGAQTGDVELTVR